jgi:hypothetical protein
MKYLPFIVSVAIFASCARGKQSGTATQSRLILQDSLKTAVSGENISGCYEMVIGRDSALLNVSVTNDSVKGNLVYNRLDKDDNIGSIQLLKEGNRLEGFYSFRSEGKLSVRQIVFKKVGTDFVEGYGDVTMKNDTVFFSYLHALTFDEKYPFKKISCR